MFSDGILFSFANKTTSRNEREAVDRRCVQNNHRVTAIENCFTHELKAVTDPIESSHQYFEEKQVVLKQFAELHKKNVFHTLVRVHIILPKTVGTVTSEEFSPGMHSRLSFTVRGVKPSNYHSLQVV